MGRQRVEQVQCDRCKRLELQPVSDTPRTAPDFSAVYMGQELVFQDLCSRCKETLGNTWLHLKEWTRESKQVLLGAQISPNAAAPLSPAPDFTPPKPHSAAGGKRS